MSVGFNYYKNTFKGTVIPLDADWTPLEVRAEDQLKRYERIYTVTAPEDEEHARDNAICAMAEVIYSIDLILSGEGGPISSASIGSVSVSYGNVISSDGLDISEKGQAKALYRAACLYLDIYRGVS